MEQHTYLQERPVAALNKEQTATLVAQLQQEVIELDQRTGYERLSELPDHVPTLKRMIAQARERQRPTRSFEQRIRAVAPPAKPQPQRQREQIVIRREIRE